MKRALLLALALASQSCAPAGPCDYRQLALDGEEGLDLTADEHGVGWMQSSLPPGLGSAPRGLRR